MSRQRHRQQITPTERDQQTAQRHTDPPRTLGQRVLQLQRTYGNRAVRRLIQRASLGETLSGVDEATYGIGQTPAEEEELPPDKEFPSQQEMLDDPYITARRRNDWAEAEQDHKERSGIILWHPGANFFTVAHQMVGKRARTPVGPFTDAPPLWQVGNFHLHPPFRKGKPFKNRWKLGPSDTDEEIANDFDSPGLLLDFADKERVEVVDYTYGPTRRQDRKLKPGAEE